MSTELMRLIDEAVAHALATRNAIEKAAAAAGDNFYVRDGLREACADLRSVDRRLKNIIGWVRA